MLRELASRAWPARGGVGQALRGRPGTPRRGDKVALENARTICRAAHTAGTTVTLDMEDHTTTDSTLGVLRDLRKDFPETGAVLPGLPAPHRGRLPRAGLRGLPGPALQGRLQRARGGRLAGRPRRRQVLRAMPQGAARRAGLPDDRDPRPAADRDRVVAGEPPRPAAQQL